MTRQSRLRAVPLLALCVAAACARPGLWVEPYLQSPGPTSIAVLWWTRSSAPSSFVEHGRSGFDSRTPASNEFVESMGKWLHEARLTGLEPETSYSYRARSGEIASATYTFRTAKRRTSDLRLSFLGDGRTDDAAVLSRHRRLVELAADSDLILELGDAVQLGTAEHWFRLLRRVLTASDGSDPGATIASQVPFHLVVGNHEIAAHPPGLDGEGRDADYYHLPQLGYDRFKAVVSNPPNGSSNGAWEELYYALDYGCVTLVVLDANNSSGRTDNHDYLADGTTPDWAPGSEQHRWMVGQLARAQAESAFTFVLFHPSPYSSGEHGSPSEPQGGHELRLLDGVFRRYGVDAVISSHDHIAERSLVGPPGFETRMDAGDPRNINYLVVGNSGQASRPRADGWERWMSIRGDGRPPFHSVWFYPWAGDHSLASFVTVRVTDDGDGSRTAAFSLVRGDGESFDGFSISRTDPEGGSTGGGDAAGGLV